MTVPGSPLRPSSQGSDGRCCHLSIANDSPPHGSSAAFAAKKPPRRTALSCLSLPLTGSPQQARQFVSAELVPAGTQPVQPVDAELTDPSRDGGHAVVADVAAAFARVPMLIPPHLIAFLA